jgi:hypothetical protein
VRSLVKPRCNSPNGFTTHTFERLLTPTQNHHAHSAQLGRRTRVRIGIRALWRHC